MRLIARKFIDAVVAVAVFAVLAPAAALADEVPILRIFLKDGTTIACYGEYTRVDDRVVLSLPLGNRGDVQQLQLVTVSAGQVDWARTERYRESARAARYAATRGEADFVQMTSAVAATLHEIARTTDPGRRLTLAEAARRQLASWGDDHYGYRAREVREIAGLLDETISELRAAAGHSQFDLSLVAIVEPPPPERLLPEPTPADGIAQALAIVELVDGPAERVALLERTLHAIEGARGSVDGAALGAARRMVEKRLEHERQADTQYERLSRQLTTLAATRASRGDVRGVQSLMSTLQRGDRRLGRQRPQLVAAIASALGQSLEQARALRLARDQWESRLPAYRSYERLVRPLFEELSGTHAALEDIRQLAGPDRQTLVGLLRSLERASRTLRTLVPPTGMSQVHELLQSSCRLGETAARVREEAVARGSLDQAWSASAAAAGSQLLLTRAREELTRLVATPSVR